MTDSNRPPAFRLPAEKADPLKLFFGKGDYVIARTANDASCFWMDHFDDLCYAKDFVEIPEFEEIEIFLLDGGICTLEDIKPDDKPFRTVAAWWVDRYGPGYLASTEE